MEKPPTLPTRAKAQPGLGGVVLVVLSLALLLHYLGIVRAAPRDLAEWLPLAGSTLVLLVVLARAAMPPGLLGLVPWLCAPFALFWVTETLLQLTCVLRPATWDEHLWSPLLASSPRFLPAHPSVHLVRDGLFWLGAALTLRRPEVSWRRGLGFLLLGLGLGLVAMLAIPLLEPGALAPIEPLELLEPGALAAAAHPARSGLVSLPLLLGALLLVLTLRTLPSRARTAALVALGLHLLLVLLSLPQSVVSVLGTVALGALCLLLGPGAAPAAPVEAKPPTQGHSLSPLEFGLLLIFFCSGFAALVYQVVYAKGLALTFGSTSHASTIVLGAYMGGLALGAWAGGHLAERLRRPILGYAVAELGIAAICATSPFALDIARRAYVSLAAGADPARPLWIGLQLAIGVALLLPPTFLMGLTLPLLTRHFLSRAGGFGTSAGSLYAVNTLGAALGGLLTSYWLLPSLGVVRSLGLAVGLNVLVAALGTLLSAKSTRAQPSEPASTGTEEGTRSFEPTRLDRRLAIIAAIQLTVGGFVTFGLETTSIHLLAVAAGTSVYAFGLMLFAFLLGLSAGAALARRWLAGQKRPELATPLVACQLLLALSLLLGLGFWNHLSDLFASFAGHAPTATFAARELVRFVVCLLVMLPPALCIGAQFPLALEAVGRGWPERRLVWLGRVSASNTFGNILGALVVGFVALPQLGSKPTLLFLILLALLLAALAQSALAHPARLPAAGLTILLGLWLAFEPRSFDLTRLAGGGNVYFQPQHYGTVIDHAESLDGGLTTVTSQVSHAGVPFKTLLTNGKFQGNNRTDDSGEMAAQAAFALCPLLHTDQRQRALLIGFGTGTTARVISDAGFRSLDLVDLSRDIITLADRHFSAVNGSVIHRDQVTVHVTDGRNFVLLCENRYDLISIELTSIWFAGAANLYNSEFYGLLAPRLTEHGVLAHWVQLHRLSHRDVATILQTLRQHFPHVWLYFLGKQGVLVACRHDCAPNPATRARLDTLPTLDPVLALFGGSAAAVEQGILLDPPRLDAWLKEYRESSGLPGSELISTDDNLFLEYSTPRGNVRGYEESLMDNLQFLQGSGTVVPLSP